MGWDTTGIVERLAAVVRQHRPAGAGLVKDLKQRGLLEDTLVVWGGEFGRTPLARAHCRDDYGRDHHARNFTMWLAGAGVSRASFTARPTTSVQHRREPVHMHD